MTMTVMGGENTFVGQVLIFANEAPRWHFARTVRSLTAAGVSRSQIHSMCHADHRDTVMKTLNSIRKDVPLWILQAGAWQQGSRWRCPPESSTGRSLIAIGLPRHSPFGAGPSEEIQEWEGVLSESQGDVESWWRANNPSIVPVSLWMDSRATIRLLQSLQDGLTLELAIQSEMRNPANRLVFWPDLNVGYDRRRRIMQVITSLQRGGAERLAIDLHECWLKQPDFSPLLVALGAPTRDAFPNPPAFVELSHRGSRPARVEAATHLVQAFGADVVHSHLLYRAELQRLSSSGVPQIVTIHNARPGWTFETEHLTAADASLLIACSMAVEKDIRDAQMPVPCRTIWNGIDPSLYHNSDDERRVAHNRMTSQLEIQDDALLLISVANVRPQKRMERLPRILQFAQTLLNVSGSKRPIHLLIAGERSSGNDLSAQSETQLSQAIDESEVADRVHRLGSVTDIRQVLVAADLFVSVSDYEGLSLAHLEALAAGVPIVATAVGGTPEIAKKDPRLSLLPKEASDHAFTKFIVSRLKEIVQPGRERPDAVDGQTHHMSPSAFPRCFTLSLMAERYQHFYRRVTETNASTHRRGLWLVINNLSTGGAQSSARRLLGEFKRRGHDVRVALLQEFPDNPTPGRQELLAAGIPVICLVPAGQIDPLTAIQPLLRAIDEQPPEAIVLWNVIAEYKILLADLLYNDRIFDVSPGEMNFHSLEKYFAKPRPGLPYVNGADYGRRLAGAIVKFHRELPVARETLQTDVHVISNGVGTPEKTVQHQEKLTLILGTAARISPQKKLEDLIAAMHLAHSRMPTYELRIAGAAEWGCERYEEELRRSAEGLSVVWLGDVQEMNGFLMSLDVFVMISEPAGCPNASLEAMAVGLPVIATDVGGVNEQVVDGVNGRLISRSNLQGLADAIVECSSNLQLRERFGNASRQHVETHFSLNKMAAEYQRVLGLSEPLP
jgi:glycosyltransferase involved in cell wall biosynthesis